MLYISKVEIRTLEQTNNTSFLGPDVVAFAAILL
jgi:hypothetical protein